MNAMLKKLVDQGFMNEAQGLYLEEAMARKESMIVSGHKGWGILPLFATMSAVAKSSFSIKQVKGFEDLGGDTQYYVIADLKDIDYGKLISDAMMIPDTGMICLKDPDHPYSIMKIFGDVKKAGIDQTKVFQVLEWAKENDVKFLAKITRMGWDENGKLVKEDFKG
ncbi:MAG TPA: hypothetical protein DCM45_03205 [Clostridiales bacterium]|nr:hypothetical protein [Clostridiales bacterium]